MFDKWARYDFVEARQIALATPTSSIQIPAWTRGYFGGNQTLKGKRIVGIDIKAEATTFPYGNQSIMRVGLLQNLMLTMIDSKGKERLKDYPILTLHNIVTAGKIRLFDFVPSMEECYIIASNRITLIGFPHPSVWLNFYTTND